MCSTVITGADQNAQRNHYSRRKKSTRKATYEKIKANSWNTNKNRILTKFRIEQSLDKYVDELKNSLKESLSCCKDKDGNLADAEKINIYLDYFEENLFSKLRSPAPGVDLLIQSKRKTSRDDLKKTKNEFENAKRRKNNNIYQAFERIGGLVWPTYEEEVAVPGAENGKLLRVVGKHYDAHHGLPKAMGGKNDCWNLLPMHASEHHDSQGIHSPDSSYEHIDALTEKYCNLWDD